MAIQPEGPQRHDVHLGGARDVLPVVDEGRDYSGDAGAMVDPLRIVVHRVRVAVDEVVPMAAIGRVRPHVRLQVAVRPPDARVDDRDDDRGSAQGHVPSVRCTDLAEAPLVHVVRIVRPEIGVDREVGRDGGRARGRTRGTREERAREGEDHQERGDPAQGMTDRACK